MIAGDADGAVSRLVSATARLTNIGLRRFAVIGGLAVTCRLATAHRATQDIDTVAETTEPPAIDVIVRTIGARDPDDPHRVEVDGIKVDVIDTVALSEDDIDGIEGTNRLFVLAHRWALEGAEPTTITVKNSDQTATVPLATAAGLLGAKTHALATRRDSRAEKRGSDTFDIYRLLDAFDREGAMAEALAAAPHDLGHLVGEHLRELLIKDAERAVRWLGQGSPEMRRVTASDLRAAAEPFCVRLL